MMRKVWKKSLSLLLAVAMLCTLVGGGALAAGDDTGETPTTPPASTNVAKIGDTEYKTLREAISAAKTGDTITLLQDCEGTAQINMNSKKQTPTALTLDLNGFAIDGKGEKRCILGVQADSRTDRCALTVKNGTLRNGAAPGSSGGAISWPCDLTIENCTIESSTNKAVAVSFVYENGSFAARDTKFLHNSETGASGSGGAVSIAGNGTAELTRCRFADNTAAYMGGAVYCDHGTMQITDCSFQSNSAAYGGAIAGMELALTLEHSEKNVTLLEGNTASSLGGAVYIQSNGQQTANSSLQVKDAEFRNNKAAFGGAIYTYVAEVDIDGTLEANEAEKDGGGLYSWYSTITATGSIIHNTAGRNGGGVCIQDKGSAKDGEALLNDCSITGNIATGSGGGLYAASGAKARVQGGSLMENSANIGGGVCLDSPVAATAKGVQADLTQAVIYNNRASTAGDDLFDFNRGEGGTTVQLPGVGSRWKLADCSEEIDGWYEDGMPETVTGEDGTATLQYGARWDAHSQPGYVQPYTATEEHSAFALKAAHKVIVPVEPDDPNSSIPKSKTATNLDKDYVSHVTLSLPALSEQLPETGEVRSQAAAEICPVDAGSRIEDYMGYVAEDYDFAFVNDIEQLELTVGGTALDKTALDENTYGFGLRTELPPVIAQAAAAEGNNEAYRFVLHYVPAEQDGEHFVLFLNEAVTKEAPVQLTYAVKLSNPKTSRGTYGQFDADGSRNYAGLYTNSRATLYPVDSEGLAGVPENFRKPTVSYTIKGGGGGHHVNPPDLETRQHFGYIIGREDGLVHPEAEITRAEATTIFFRLLKEESRKANWGDQAPFRDVTPADWYNHAAATLHKLGVVSGYPDGSFAPDAPITRAEFVKLATGFFQYQYTGTEQFFNDISDSWAADAIRAAASMGLIDGYPDGSFRPDAPISRAEAVAIVNRTLGRTPEGSKLATRTDMIVWPDNKDTSAWYYADIQEATNSHDYTRADQQSREAWTGMQKMRDWAALEREWADSNTSTNPGDVA